MSLLDLKGKKILIVDDYDEMRNLIRGMVEPLRPDKIVTCKNGVEAIGNMEKTAFDIVFCDYNLGKGKDGQQILEEARHRSLLPYAAIFFMITAESTSDMVMAAIDYLPDDYLSKPFTKSLLIKRLQKICERKAELGDINKAFKKKDYLRALKLCNKALQEKPKGQTELLKTKGELLFRLGQQDAAQQFYEELLEQRDLPWAKLALGDIYFHRKSYIEAQEIFESMIRENPANIQAHDALARVCEKTGELQRCQSILISATEKSPKSLLRQRKLAEIALRNDDAETAMTAFERAIEEGKYSCYKHPGDYCGYAKTLLQNDQLDNALVIIERIKKEFKGAPEALFYSAALRAVIHLQTKNLDECKKALQEVLQEFAKQPDVMDIEIALDVIATALAVKQPDEIENLVRYLVGNNFDNDALLDRLLEFYRQHGFEEIGTKIINDTKQEIIKINNEGAKLLKEGKLEESIEFFIKAAKSMPQNTTININAAFSMIMQIEATGKTSKYYSRAERYLERVQKIDPSLAKCQQLMQKLRSLAKEAA